MFNRQKILLVDPSAIFRRTLKEVIETNETFVEVLEAESSDQAESMMARKTPDVVFMDIALPQNDGIPFIASIRRIAPKARIVVLTSHDSEEHEDASLTQGADFFLSKERSGGLRLIDVIHETIRRQHSV
jgi:DNA-binding NarL/FixJ family response regulator